MEEGLEENGRERVFGGGGCVYVLAFSKDTSRTKKKKKKVAATHHLLMAAIKDIIK